MHLGLRQLSQFLDLHAHQPNLVLAVVTATHGSSYRKPGAMMLIAPDDSYAGLISGGCLEGDLLHRAKAVMTSGDAEHVVYDLHDNEDAIWGLGLGCGGVIELLLVRLEPKLHFELFRNVFGLTGTDPIVEIALALRDGGVLQDGSAPFAVGALAVGGPDRLWEGDDALIKALAAAKPAGKTADKNANPGKFDRNTGYQRTRRLSSEIGDQSKDILLISISPTPKVLICGGGPDAVPLVSQILALGWSCVLVDHRPAFASAERFHSGVELVVARPRQLAEVVDLARVNAAVVMSHHIENDGEYLAQLAPHPLDYLGLLGPLSRKQQILQSRGLEDLSVFGPAGLDVGAELPEAIALAITAEIHAHFNDRDGRSLNHE